LCYITLWQKKKTSVNFGPQQIGKKENREAAGQYARGVGGERDEAKEVEFHNTVGFGTRLEGKAGFRASRRTLGMREIMGRSAFQGGLPQGCAQLFKVGSLGKWRNRTRNSQDPKREKSLVWVGKRLVLLGGEKGKPRFFSSRSPK